MQSHRTHIKAGQKLKRALCFFLLSSAVASADTRWAWMVEPSFMDYKVRERVAGSDRTILALVQVKDGEIFGAEGGHPRTLEMASKEIDKEATQTVKEVFDSLQPRYVRDKNGVIEYAVLESTNPLTASAVLAPEFAERFAGTLGPDLLVALPNRFQILVFSRQDQAFQKMSEFIISGYLSSTYPVSREIFSLEKGKLRSIGVLQ